MFIITIKSTPKPKLCARPGAMVSIALGGRYDWRLNCHGPQSVPAVDYARRLRRNG